jgi:hypothetical protein
LIGRAPSLLLLLLAAGAGCAPRGQESGRSLDEQSRAASDRALAFLGQHSRRLTVDVVAQLRFIEGIDPKSRARDIALAGREAARERLSDPAFAALMARPRPPHPARPLPPVPSRAAAPSSSATAAAEPFNERFSDRCLAGALECRLAPGCQEFVSRQGTTGYTATHQLLFLIVAVEKGCFPELAPVRTMGALAARLHREQGDDGRFSDLFAERMALGAHAGFREFLAERWIREIVDRQLPEGCWYFDGDHPWCNLHATGMAAWVLTAYQARLDRPLLAAQGGGR